MYIENIAKLIVCLFMFSFMPAIAVDDGECMNILKNNIQNKFLTIRGVNFFNGAGTAEIYRVFGHTERIDLPRKGRNFFALCYISEPNKIGLYFELYQEPIKDTVYLIRMVNNYSKDPLFLSHVSECKKKRLNHNYLETGSGISLEASKDNIFRILCNNIKLLENDIYIFKIEDEIYKDIKKRKDDSILIETISYSLEITMRFTNETHKPIFLQYYISTEGGVKWMDI